MSELIVVLLSDDTLLSLQPTQVTLHPHLTPEQNLRLTRVLHGRNGECSDRAVVALLDEPHEKAKSLNRLDLRMLHVALALIAGRHMLVLSQLSDTLSTLAEQTLMNHIVAVGKHCSHQVFYLTKEINRLLLSADRVMLVRDGVAVSEWLRNELPILLLQAVELRLTLESELTVDLLIEKTARLDFIVAAEKLSANLVRCVLSDETQIVSLLTVCGRSLLSLQTGNASVTALSQLLVDSPLNKDSQTLMKPSNEVSSRMRSINVNAVRQLSECELRRHIDIGSLGAFIYVIVAYIAQLMVIVVFDELYPEEPSIAIGRLLISSSTVPLLFVWNAVAYWRNSRNMIGAGQHSFLRQFDLSMTSRLSLLASIMLTHLPLGMLHGWPMLIALLFFGQQLTTFAAIIAVWMLLAVLTIGVSVGLGTVVIRPKLIATTKIIIWLTLPWIVPFAFEPASALPTLLVLLVSTSIIWIAVTHRFTRVDSLDL